jgi:hypothetical protein
VSKSIGYKPFSQDNYDKSKWVEEIIFDKIKLANYNMVKNDNKFGIDILIIDDNQIVGGIEAEQHSKYWKEYFPFKTVHFLGRKKKYSSHNNYYVMVNSDGTKAVMIPFRDLTKYNTTLMNNSSCDNEPIYDIPCKNCIWGWDIITKFIENDLSKISTKQLKLGECNES